VHLENIYHKLPIALQNIGCSLVGWKICRTRFGPPFWRHLQQAEQRAKWSDDRLLAYRDQRIREFVAHAAATVPYYRRLFREQGIDPRQIRTLDDLKQLPILSKEEVQNHGRQMISDAVPPRQHIIAHTSGTTGGGLRFATTLDAEQQQFAVWARYRRWHGVDLKDWCGYFGGRSVVPLSQTCPPFWRYNRPGRHIFFSGYHLTPENLPHYAAELRRRQPPWIHGYPSLLALLAAHLLDTRSDLGYRPGNVTVSADSLLSQQAEIIERALGVRPTQHYGMAEAVANISECERGKLHVDEDFAAVEFVPNPDGCGHKIVGTNFTNPATPLLRYDVQDTATLSDGPCSCGRPGRTIEDVDGRREDYVVLKNGARVGRMDHVFKDLINIREAQIYQQRAGEITIRVVRRDGYTPADEEQLLRETRQRIGQDTKVLIQYVDGLERSPTGKLRFVISDLQEGKLGQPTG